MSVIVSTEERGGVPTVGPARIRIVASVPLVEAILVLLLLGLLRRAFEILATVVGCSIAVALHEEDLALSVRVRHLGVGGWVDKKAVVDWSKAIRLLELGSNYETSSSTQPRLSHVWFLQDGAGESFQSCEQIHLS